MDGLDWNAALAALAWQVDLGATEAILDAPVNRYELGDAQPAPKAAAAAAVAATAALDPVAAADPVEEARRAAAAAPTLEALREAMAAYDHCDLKRGARNTVFCDGNPAARLMLIGEAPGREEDAAGRPFVGRAGQLLDRMFAAIGLARTSPDPAGALYITNVMPWRPPQNRDPSAEEVAMMTPFLARHVELAAPDLIVVTGNTACAALLGRTGITRLRGRWAEAWGRPVMPMCHPAYLLRNPEAKREAWADLLEVKARLAR
ncbi:uracil-DNA glycosylase [Cereibacter sphaeroides f. sp. denitrificans]|uniref:uracil-DNA glycosylase n=1 Tax=Cereibacter johrii TaxID=445629 RepID=UPI000E1E2410|nr:uracil-DNA glycosylase [Cereibacter johrii]MEA5159552.1 uracil-DNA glycosylase [Cereibacter johrii]RDS93828.1 uracil-DNA glycosylase [Cereibacter sphaeroides f. sp. denitrificans]